MVLLLYVVLNGLAIYGFTRMRKRLHVLEVLVCWMVASYLVQNFSALCYMNFKTLLVSEQFGYELAHFLNRTVLYPLIIVAFLNFYIVADTTWKKLALVLGFILILVGFEWLADALRVLIHVHWRIWWSFAVWMTILLVCLGFMRWFRRLLYKDAVRV